MNENITKVELPRAKRIFDIIGALLLLLIAMPFLILLFIWILLEQICSAHARGSIFYLDKRVSQGKEFDLYKFRIFKKSALKEMIDKDGFIHTKKLEHNPKNMTLYGRFLKQIYMDEFPQVFNVLRGDMTLVGPRPTNLENSNKLKAVGNFTKEIMKCGLTGDFQTQKGVAGASDREIDTDYINFCAKNSGWKVVLNDIKIIFKTILTVLKAKGI